MNVLTIAVIALSAVCMASLAFGVRAYRNASEARNDAYEALNKAAEHRQSVERQIKDLKALIPEDVREEKKRRDVLMRELNDEMEIRLEAERTWNKMVNGIINYDVPTAAAR